MTIQDIATWQLASAYLLLLLPLAVILWYKIPILAQTALAVVRMTAIMSAPSSTARRARAASNAARSKTRPRISCPS